MKPAVKWPLIFGGLAALANLATSIFTSLCGLVLAPAAAAVASYMVVKEESGPHLSPSGARAGLIVGSIASVGLFMGAAMSALFWNAPTIAMTIANARDMSDLGLGVTASAAGALFVIALALLVALVSTAMCAGIGAIVAAVVRANRSTPSSPPE